VTCEADANAAEARGSRCVGEWAAEASVYALVAVCLLSRHYLPELSLYTLAVALGLAALLPPFVMSDRREAAVLGRLAAAMCLGLLLVWRAPIQLPVTIPFPGGEELHVSVCAAVSLVLAVSMLAVWLRTRPPIPWWVIAVVGGVVAFSAVVWPLLAWGLSLDPENDVMHYEATLRSLSATAQYGVLMAYTLTVEPLGRRRRLALIAVVALAVRVALPTSGGG